MTVDGRLVAPGPGHPGGRDRRPRGRRPAGRGARARRPAGDRGDAAHATPALAAIERIAAEVEGAFVGAGTVTTPAQVDDALAAGARFLVSPGATPNLLDAMQAADVPFLPGTATPSDVRRAARARDHLREVLPGRDRRRHQGAEGVRGPVPADALLPDGRDRRRQRAGLPGAAERRVRRRLVDDQGRRRARRGAARGRGASASSSSRARRTRANSSSTSAARRSVHGVERRQRRDQLLEARAVDEACQSGLPASCAARHSAACSSIAMTSASRLPSPRASC